MTAGAEGVGTKTSARPPASGVFGGSRGRALLLAVGLLALGTLAAYHNSLGGPFVFDDNDSITDNPTIRRLWPLTHVLMPPPRMTVNGRPALNLSFALNYAAGGIAPWGYHAVNLGIHLLAGLALFGIVRRTLLQPVLRERYAGAALPVAFVAALLWLLHPVQTESVTYVVQRAESLMGLFYLLTLYCFARGSDLSAAGLAETDGRPPSTPLRGVAAGRPAARAWFGLAWAACLLGMATKEVMVTAPVIVLLYDRTFVSGTFREAWRRHHWLYAALAATWLCFVPVFLHGGKRDESSGFGIVVPWWTYARTQFHAVLHYARMTFWPHPLPLYYEPAARIDFQRWRTAAHLWTYGPAVVLLAAATLAALRWRPVVGFLGAWVFAILAPTSLVPGGSEVVTDRRLYLPLAAATVAVAVAAFRWAGRRGLALLLIPAAVLGVLTERHNAVFRTSLDFWNYQAAVRPQDPMAPYNAGTVLAAAGRTPEAMAKYAEALRLNPNYVDAHVALSESLDRLGRTEAANRELAVAERIDPGSAYLQDILGTRDFEAGRWKEGREHFERVLQVRPNEPTVHNDVGVALAQEGQVAQAVGQFEEAVRLNPDFADAECNLGRAFAQLGNTAAARVHYERALRLDPNQAGAKQGLRALAAPSSAP